MTTKELVKGLTESGFIVKAKQLDYIPDDFEDDTDEYRLFNDMNVYIGEVLAVEGFKQKDVIERNKKWTVFSKDNIEISHRSLEERPDTKEFELIIIY